MIARALILGLMLLAAPAMAQDQADAVIRGRYQAILGDCAACHSRPGGKPLAGGNPLKTPFGDIVPPNITPDRETGTGAWTEGEFVRMMRTGIGRGGKRLYPAMPYPAYSKMSDRDLADLFAYMQTVEPVSNLVIANQLPFPFNIRLSLIGWNLLNFRSEPFKSDPAQSEAWNRGAYLVNGAAHCGACHTPKNLLGADKESQPLQGFSLQGWLAPDITGDPHRGIGGWSREELVAYLKTGANRFSIASGPMAEAVENSTSKMSDTDLEAIAVYLQSLKPAAAEKPRPLPTEDRRMTAGAAIYRDNCVACHGWGGQGAAGLFPALAGSPLVQQNSSETLAHLVLAGSQGAHTEKAPTAPAMPSLAWRLDDRQVADVLSFVRNSWGNAAEPVNAASVASVRKALGPGDAEHWLWIATACIAGLLVAAAAMLGVIVWRKRRDSVI